MKEGGRTIGATSTISRGVSSPSFSIREAVGIRPASFSPISTNRIGVESTPRINLGGLKPFVPNSRGLTNEGPVIGFNPKNTAEFPLSIPAIPAEAHVSTRRRQARHSRIPVGEQNKFRPMSFGQPDRTKNSAVSLPFDTSPIVKPERAPSVPLTDGTKLMNKISEKSKKVTRVSSGNSVSAIIPPDVVKPKPDQTHEIKMLEDVVANVRTDVAKPKYGVESTQQPQFGRADSPRIIGVGLGERIIAAPVVKKKFDENEEKKKRQDVLNPLRRNPDAQTLSILGIDNRTSLLKKAELKPTVKPVNSTGDEVQKETQKALKTDEKVVYEHTPNKVAVKSPEKNKPPKKHKPIRDKGADDARLQEILQAKEEVMQKSIRQGTNPTWADVVKLLPPEPTDPTISGIVKGPLIVNRRTIDGSIPEYKKHLSKMGVIFPKQKPEAVLNANPAVKLGENGERVSAKDVARVIGEDLQELIAA